MKTTPEKAQAYIQAMPRAALELLAINVLNVLALEHDEKIDPPALTDSKVQDSMCDAYDAIDSALRDSRLTIAEIAAFEPPAPVAESARDLSFDGCGINGPDKFRTRLATFTNNEAARAYGPLFAAAPEMRAELKACETVIDFQLTNTQALANLMDEPSGLAVIYQMADKLGVDLARVRALIAKTERNT